MSLELLKGLLMFTFFQTLVLSGAILFLLNMYQKHRLALISLLLLFLLTAIRSATFYINNFSEFIFLEPYVNYMLRIPIFIQPVLIFIFIRSCVNPPGHLGITDIIHFIPAILLFLSIQIWHLLDNFPTNISNIILNVTFINCIEVFQLLFYSIASWIILRNQNLSISGYHWLKGLVICTFLVGLAVLYGTIIVSFFTSTKYNPFIFAHIFNGIIILVLTFIVLSGFLKWQNIFKTESKYFRSALSNQKIATIREKLLFLMEVERLYLDPDLKLENICKPLNISRFQASQFFSRCFNKTFYEFINEYRIESAQNKLLSSEHHHKNISEIAYSSGYNSLSTFNRSFKSIIGKTPSEYRNAYQTID